MKKKIIFAGLFVIGIATLVLFFGNKQKQVHEITKQQSKSVILSPTPAFTNEQLQQYYLSYQDPFVINLRKALNGYLDGTNTGIDSPPDIVIKTSSDKDLLNGLSSFSKEYYKSKFIVFSIENSLGGGKNIAIIFQDKPDKLFIAWVYKLADGTYVLRGFGQNLNFNESKMRIVKQQYQVFLKDKTHAI